ncbi:sensor histidine kinase [Paenibacillus sp. NPDC058174]|uniref:sensor histidine kinase n=1 Tax=Paenibacillus sp. NPDC058174 TaxID=3346366 RepID=UPI0036DFA346
MNIKRRLALRFVFQLSIAGIVSLLIVVLTGLWVIRQYAEIQISRDFASVGLERLVESSKLTKDGFEFEPGLLERVKKNNGWLQSLDENGQVERSYNTPNDVPKQYTSGQLMEYWLNKNSFPYEIYLWVQQKEGKLFTLIYGTRNELTPLFEQVKAGSALSGKELIIPERAADRLRALGGFVQLLDRQGKELASFNKPKGVEDHYKIDDMVVRTLYFYRFDDRILTSYDEDTGRTWIVGVPNISGGSVDRGWLPPEGKVLLTAMTVMFVALIIVFILLSLWNAHRFGGPMLHTLAWLNSLGKGDFNEPLDRRGIAGSRKRTGEWRSRYRVFAEVLYSIDHLAATLLRNQKLREQNKHLREEWISGITHDLKTPLSSIKGYTHMLAEDSYEWSPEEVRKFSRIMLEKAAHMDTLINDLAMSYRISAGMQQEEGERIELNEWMAEALERAGSNPLFNKERIRFVPAAKPLYAKLHKPWMERIVANIAANVWLYNPPETVLTVKVEEVEDRGQAAISFSDNGNGMDGDTANRLFERYYRGTDSASSTDGSGLGMAIAKGLVEAMSGEITVRTYPGTGTTIRLTFPTIK